MHTSFLGVFQKLIFIHICNQKKKVIFVHMHNFHENTLSCKQKYMIQSKGLPGFYTKIHFKGMVLFSISYKSSAHFKMLYLFPLIYWILLTTHENYHNTIIWNFQTSFYFKKKKSGTTCSKLWKNKLISIWLPQKVAMTGQYLASDKLKRTRSFSSIVCSYVFPGWHSLPSPHGKVIYRYIYTPLQIFKEVPLLEYVPHWIKVIYKVRYILSIGWSVCLD